MIADFTGRISGSVITAVYNVASYLSEAIESILCQDIGFKDSVELILVDDGSTDSSGCKGNSSVSGRGGPSVWLVQYFDIIRV